MTLFPVRFSPPPLFDHGEAMPESLKLDEMTWNDLLRQVRDNPDPKIRSEAARQAMERVWNGWNGDEDYCPRRMWEADW